MVLLIAILSLTCIAGASAADTGTAQTQTTNTSAMQINAEPNEENNLDKPATNQNSTGNVSNTTQPPVITKAAAGEIKTRKSFTLNEIKDAAARVKSWIKNNHDLPNYVTISTAQVSMPDFLKLLTKCLLQLKSGKKSPITLKTINYPLKPVENIKSGNINKKEYLSLAKRINAFIDKYGRVPNYAASTLGKLRYESMIYMFSRILSFQKVKKRLPNYVTMTRWSTISVPATLQKYLKATANCQVNDAQIKARAAKITEGVASTYSKAVKIFNWVRDNTSYKFYNNTRKGAICTLNTRTGNCCDISHLLIALTRAAGIPARYVHGKCKFLNGKWYGHVWAQVWVNGKWHRADAINSKNTLGAVTNWNTATAIIKGRYASLPF